VDVDKVKPTESAENKPKEDDWEEDGGRNRKPSSSSTLEKRENLLKQYSLVDVTKNSQPKKERSGAPSVPTIRESSDNLILTNRSSVAADAKSGKEKKFKVEKSDFSEEDSSHKRAPSASTLEKRDKMFRQYSSIEVRTSDNKKPSVKTSNFVRSSSQANVKEKHGSGKKKSEKTKPKSDNVIII